MKTRLPLLLFIVLFTTILLGLFPSQTHSANFASTYLRLDRMSANTAISGLLCAKPSTAGAGTENKISITFPSDFTLSPLTSNWTTGTTSLPAGTSAWPGISANTQTVSGQTVTFGSSDLTSSSTTYCFTFTTSGSTTGAAGGKTGTIQTLTAANASIDSTTFGTTITPDRITVSATVPADPNDISSTITANTSGSNFPQDSVLGYTITYGSNLTSPITLKIVASWSLGTVSGSPTPTVNILDYVSGSASQAYNGTPPVIDTVNRTITWEIASFPAQTTNRTVTFSLRTSNGYTGSQVVSFDVSTYAEAATAQSTTEKVTQTYLYYAASVTPTPTSTPGPTATGMPGSTATPTPTAPTSLQPITFRDIAIRTITATSASIHVLLSQPAGVTIRYGTSPQALTKQLTTAEKTTSYLLTLPDLLPDTPYYFQIRAVDTAGKQFRSDIYTFTTAQVSQPPSLEKKSLIVTSGKVVLSAPIVVLPTKVQYEFQFRLTQLTPIKFATAFIKEKNSTPRADTLLFAAHDGTFSGKLQTGDRPETVALFAHIYDLDGNIVEQQIATLRIINPLTVLNSQTKRPIEHASISLSLYNPRTKIYELASPDSIAITNPSYTDSAGVSRLVLPLGKYRAEVTASGYKRNIVDFTIGEYAPDDFPGVLLTPLPFSFLTFLQELWEALHSLWATLLSSLQSIAQSHRYFTLLSVSGLVSLVALSLYSFKYKTHVSFRSFPALFLIHGFGPLFRRDTARVISGKVIDDQTKLPIAHADIYLSEKSSGIVLAHIITNVQGNFYWKDTSQKEIILSVLKNDYLFHEPILVLPELLPLTVTLAKKAQTFVHVLHTGKTLLRRMLGMFFEVFLFASLALELAFIPTLGIAKVMPFIIISLINLLLWLSFLMRDTTPTN